MVVERDEDGRYVASCPALQGCHTEGNTYKEAVANIKDAIDLAVTARIDVGDPVCTPWIR